MATHDLSLVLFETWVGEHVSGPQQPSAAPLSLRKVTFPCEASMKTWLRSSPRLSTASVSAMSSVHVSSRHLLFGTTATPSPPSHRYVLRPCIVQLRARPPSRERQNRKYCGRRVQVTSLPLPRPTAPSARPKEADGTSSPGIACGRPLWSSSWLIVSSWRI